jgi:AP-3 complex subunit mu
LLTLPSKPILEHVYTGRPPSAKILIPLWLAQPQPRPSVIYLANTNPPTILHSVLQDRLLFLCPSSEDTEPLAVLEFLHRAADALEEFLGSPLLASKIETSYDVVAQLLGEMCDAGVICNTEPDALRDSVEAPSWMKSLVGGLGLPASSPAITPTSSSFSLQKPPLRQTMSNTGSAIPWRRANVRHTSNEMYVDIVETLSVIIAPSGQPLSALANGTIAFTCKVSGVPDLLLTLTCPGGKMGIERAFELPVFHPCVRLARWRERPGDLSFVPPDGRFVLAGYEVDLLGSQAPAPSTSNASNLQLPATVEVTTSLGPTGSDFEVRLVLSNRFASATGPSSTTSSASSLAPPRPGSTSSFRGPAANTSASPSIQDLIVSIPLPSTVRNLTELRPSRGEAHYAPGDGAVEWRLRGKDATASSAALLRCTVVGRTAADDDEAPSNGGFEPRTDTYDYDESEDGAASSYQSGAHASAARRKARGGEKGPEEADERDSKRVRLNAALMPSSANVSFKVKGWLASGIKVDSLVINTKASRGLGAGVTPYKGVKYLTASNHGVEVRC